MQTANVIYVDFHRRKEQTPTLNTRVLGAAVVLIINFVIAWLMVGVVWPLAWWWR
jgi:hypothetical protein